MRQFKIIRSVLTLSIVTSLSILGPLPISTARAELNGSSATQVINETISTPEATQQLIETTAPANPTTDNVISQPKDTSTIENPINNPEKQVVEPIINIENTSTVDSSTGNLTGSKIDNLGNASSGNAQSNATQINIIGSDSQNKNLPNVSNFTTNYEGDVKEDLNIDLYHLLTMPSSSTVKTVDINCCNQTNTEINNNIKASSQSGNLDLAKNKTIETVTSGDAYANANLINLIDSEFNNGQLFVGQINIQGNLTGDILLPTDFMAGLKQSKLTLSQDDSQQSYDLNNTIKMDTASGGITADRNSKLGPLTSGNTTNIHNDYSLKNASIQGENALLLFVNVTGEWQGGIMNNAGTTNSFLVGTINEIGNTNRINLFKDIKINNMVDVSAASGYINLSENSEVKTARTGNATSIANIANIMGADFSLNKYFGILFINIIGNWYGSFGINTPYGNPVVIPSNNNHEVNHSDVVLVQVQSKEPESSTNHARSVVKTKVFNEMDIIDQDMSVNKTSNHQLTNKINQDYFKENLSSINNSKQDPDWLVSALGGVGGIALAGMISNNKFKRYRKN